MQHSSIVTNHIRCAPLCQLHEPLCVQLCSSCTRTHARTYTRTHTRALTRTRTHAHVRARTRTTSHTQPQPLCPSALQQPLRPLPQHEEVRRRAQGSVPVSGCPAAVRSRAEQHGASADHAGAGAGGWSWVCVCVCVRVCVCLCARATHHTCTADGCRW